MYMSNAEVYNKWCELQKSNNRPTPEYPLEAYTQEIIDTWYNVLMQEEALKFNYQMLDRLQSDCNYYLGFGNRCTKHLYYKTEQEHIEEMKKLYNNFPTDKKPEWLTYEQILTYEKAMTNNRRELKQ